MYQMDDEPMLRDTTLYSDHENISGLLAQAHNFVQMSHTPVTCILFASSNNVFEQFDESAYSGFHIHTEHMAEGLFMGNLSRRYGRKHRKTVRGQFILLKLPYGNTYLAMTDESTAFIEHGLYSLLRKAYPFSLMPFFHSRDMESFLDAIAERIPTSVVMLTKVSLKSRIQSDRARKMRESDMKWTDRPYGEMFAEIRQKDSWIAKMSFDVLTRRDTPSGSIDRTVLEGVVSRDGIFRCEKDFHIFYETVIAVAAQCFAERCAKLSDRARTEATGYVGKPMCIEFEDPVFNDRQQLRRLGSIVGALPNSSHSILHCNPYLHMAVTDSIDNSNFDVWVLSPNRITISPQTLCSGGSLSRFADHVSREFNEGVIKDLSEVQY